MSQRNLTAIGLGLTLLLGAAGGHALSDPTRPSGSAATASAGGDSAWRLTATRITPERRSATINGIEVAEGATLGSARVLRISHAEVQLDMDGRHMTLHLLPAEVKTIR